MKIDTGTQTNYNLGHDVALSGDGQIMAAVALGYVRVYDKQGIGWNMFQQINDPSSSHTAYSLDLSYDGSTLAIASLYSNVYIYNKSGNDYILLEITGDDGIQAFEVAVSGDGNTVAVTTSSENDEKPYHTAFFFFKNNNKFERRGNTFKNYGFQSGIALNYDGTIAAVGQRNHDSRRGVVLVHKWRGSNWDRMGAEIYGPYQNVNFGYQNAISITNNGFTLAIGDHTRNRVALYDYTASAWYKRSDELVGTTTSLSEDGTYIAVGTYTSDKIEIFEKKNVNYESMGEITNNVLGSRFGWSLDMSKDGTSIAIGAYKFNDIGQNYILSPSLPSANPSMQLSHEPSLKPSSEPSPTPTLLPSIIPSNDPSIVPSYTPSLRPSSWPSKCPSDVPSSKPSRIASNEPSTVPSKLPSKLPSSVPSLSPTHVPSELPSIIPTHLPYVTPTSLAYVSLFRKH